MNKMVHKAYGKFLGKIMYLVAQVVGVYSANTFGFCSYIKHKVDLHRESAVHVLHK